MYLISSLAKFSICICFITNAIHFSFAQDVTNAGIIAVNSDTASIAYYFVGETANPILNIESPSGGNPQLDLEYLWRFSQVPSISFSIAPEDNDQATYIPSTDTTGTFYYVRLVRRAGFNIFASSSNLVILIVEPGNIENGGLIGADHSVMINEQPDTIFEIEPPSGGNPNVDFEYEWVKITSSNMEEPAEGIIDQPFYVPPPLVETTTFIRKARREGFTDYLNSNQVIIEVEPTSIENIEDEIVLVYPNPVTNYLQIEFQENSSSNWLMKVFDLKGRLQKNILLENVNQMKTINFQNLAEGAYLIQLTNLENNKGKRFKILKK